MSFAVNQQANNMNRNHPTRALEQSESQSVEDVDASPKVRRTHAERREEAEQRMLDAAVRIVADRGLEYLTLAECGEAAGYSRGLAAHYFGSKDALTAAIANHIVASYAQRSRGGSGGRKGLDGFLDSVAFYIENGRGRLLQLRAFNAVLSSGLTHPAVSGSIAKLNSESVEAFARGLRMCLKQGAIRADVDPTAQATMIISMLRGVMTQWLLDPEGVDLDKVKAELLTSLRRSLAP
jgi:AcrR family transcriptional regulator